MCVLCECDFLCSLHAHVFFEVPNNTPTHTHPPTHPSRETHTHTHTHTLIVILFNTCIAPVRIKGCRGMESMKWDHITVCVCVRDCVRANYFFHTIIWALQHDVWFLTMHLFIRLIWENMSQVWIYWISWIFPREQLDSLES